MKTKSYEFQQLDSAMRKILSLSHDELKQRDKEYKKQRKWKKRAKS